MMCCTCVHFLVPLKQIMCTMRLGYANCLLYLQSVAYPGILFEGGSTNSVEDRENEDLGAVAP